MRSERIARLLERLGETNGLRVWRAPGRVNIIGEHLDYTGGLVLPFGCDLDVLLAAVPLDGEVACDSLDEPGRARVRLDGAGERPQGWGRYVAGVVEAAVESGLRPRGFRGVLCSTVPVGAGLSSSAALEAAVALALLGSAPAPRVLQRAEHLAVGVPCGIMDQTCVLRARAGHALLVDCAAERWEHVPLPEEAAFVVVDTGTRRALDDGRYAARRTEAERAVAKAGDPRGLSEPEAEGAAGLTDVERRRLRHLVTENRRVLEAVEGLRAGDVQGLGRLVDASHASLRGDFDVSSPELDLVADVARATDGCAGARLVGAGFAGCVLAVVRAGAEDGVARRLSEDLRTRLPAVRAFAIRPVDGAGELSARSE